jgi:hypothetical protein
MPLFGNEVKHPDDLTISQWVKIIYPDPETQAELEDSVKRAALTAKRNNLEKNLDDACRTGELKYAGDLSGWEWVIHPTILSNTRFNSPSKPIPAGDNVQKYRQIRKSTATIHKTEFKRFLQKSGEWPIKIKGLRDDWWPDDELKALDAADDIKPREGGYSDRDKIAIDLVKQMPELLAMRPGAIKKELQAKSNKFLTGYSDWWRGNPVFPKGEPGRNPKLTK